MKSHRKLITNHRQRLYGSLAVGVLRSSCMYMLAWLADCGWLSGWLAGFLDGGVELDALQAGGLAAWGYRLTSWLAALICRSLALCVIASSFIYAHLAGWLSSCHAGFLGGGCVCSVVALSRMRECLAGLTVWRLHYVADVGYCSWFDGCQASRLAASLVWYGWSSVSYVHSL